MYIQMQNNYKMMVFTYFALNFLFWWFDGANFNERNTFFKKKVHQVSIFFFSCSCKKKYDKFHKECSIWSDDREASFVNEVVVQAQKYAK